MLKSIVSAFFVFRLELRSPLPLDGATILLEWLHRPAIEILFQQRESEEENLRLHEKLNEVYPF